MAIQSLINGKAIASISAQDRGLQYGDGLFETIAIDQGKVLCLNEHLTRLIESCASLKIPPPDLATLRNEIESLNNSAECGVIKIIITRGQGGRAYAVPETNEITRIVSLYPWPEYAAENVTVGINTRLCQYRYSHNPALAGIKHLNRLEQVLARSEWTSKEFAEGIVMDKDDNIIEGTMSNLFYVKNGVLITPDLSDCGVAGIVRKKLIELAQTLDIELHIEKTSLESLMSADEVFLCNSIIGLWPVKMIDKKQFFPGEITKNIRARLEEHQVIAKLC